MNDMCDIYTHMYVPKSFRMQNIYQHYSLIKYIEGDFLGIRTVMEFSLARAKVFGPIKWTGDSVHPMHIFNGFVLAKKRRYEVMCSQQLLHLYSQAISSRDCDPLITRD